MNYKKVEEKDKKTLGIYIHIPFCKKKCHYCDFTSLSNKDDSCIKRYKDVLKKEIKYKVSELKDDNNIRINTIYIGGGTPSYIDSKYIIEIIKEVKKEFNILVLDNVEVTIEVNPGTITKQKLVDYINIGVNRISIGLQSTSNSLLELIGRIHTYEEFEKTYELAVEAGFKNINVDLMLGLPKQTIEDIKESVNKIINLNPKPNHISIYSLILEENTKLKDMIDNGIVKIIEEDERDMYWTVKKMLENNEYAHYEISNFAKQGYESKHNLDCWNQKEYLGFGLGAHSYFDNKRYSNIEDLNKYINNENVINIEEVQSEEEKQKEYMLLGLRKIEGIDISEFKNRFTTNPIYIYKEKLDKLHKQNLIEIDKNNIKLTNKGLDFANIVWEEFV